MEKMISYSKLSKKEKRKMDLAGRKTWGDLNPVTRKPRSSRAYDRNKFRNRDASDSGYFLLPPAAEKRHSHGLYRFPGGIYASEN